EWFIVSFILGAIFLSVQSYEYADMVTHGISVSSSAYGSAFYITTGFHALHVLGGLIAMLFVIGRAYLAKRFGNHESTIAIVVSVAWWVRTYVLQCIVRSAGSTSIAPEVYRNGLVTPHPVIKNVRNPQSEGTLTESPPPHGRSGIAVVGSVANWRLILTSLQHQLRIGVLRI